MRYLIVNDDVVVAYCPTHAQTGIVSCSLVIPTKYYKLTVSSDLQVMGGVSHIAGSNERAIAIAKEYFDKQYSAAKEYWSAAKEYWSAAKEYWALKN